MDNILNAYNLVPNIADDIGYEMKTTFWGDFSIADVFGEDAIKDTFNRSFKSFKNDKIYGTELSLVLNWKSWMMYEKGKKELAKLYADLWGKVDSYILDNWKGEDLDYYLKTTD